MNKNNLKESPEGLSYLMETGYLRVTAMKQKHNSLSATPETMLPVRDALDVLGGKWRIPILILLAGKSMGFGSLRRELDGISPKVLSQELRILEQNKLLNRNVVSTRPLAVEYSITRHCDELEKIILSLKSWGVHHRSKVIGNGSNDSKTSQLP